MLQIMCTQLGGNNVGGIILDTIFRFLEISNISNDALQLASLLINSVTSIMMVILTLFYLIYTIKLFNNNYDIFIGLNGVNIFGPYLKVNFKNFGPGTSTRICFIYYTKEIWTGKFKIQYYKFRKNKSLKFDNLEINQMIEYEFNNLDMTDFRIPFIVDAQNIRGKRKRFIYKLKKNYFDNYEMDYSKEYSIDNIQRTNIFIYYFYLFYCNIVINIRYMLRSKFFEKAKEDI